MNPGITVRRFSGAGIGPWLDEVARLRVAVFRKDKPSGKPLTFWLRPLPV